MCDDWTAKILNELEKDKNGAVQSSRPDRQKIERDINNIDDKVSKLIDLHLDGTVSAEEYIKKKEELLNKKKDLQERLLFFGGRDDNWFERAKDFVTDLNRIGCALQEGNLELQREYLEKIGSNFILKERRLIFSTEGTLRLYLSNAPYPTWRRGRDSNPGYSFSTVWQFSKLLP